MRELLRERAETLDWPKLSALERAGYYENWAKDPKVGGVLANFMDPRKVRVYIKDSLMKPYQRHRLHDEFKQVLRSLNVEEASVGVVATFSQPHGRQLADGRIICWGNTRDWKVVLFAVFERGFTRSAIPFAAVLLNNGRPMDQVLARTAAEARSRLGIDLLQWID
jgi:hypothetical protein